MSSSPFLFPRWTNETRTVIAIGAGVFALYAGVIVTFGFSPQATDVGYQPHQPVPYSHALHAGKLAIDCRYCHTAVEEGAHANIPATETCINCHANVNLDLRAWKIKPIEESYQSGTPVSWIRVHDLPDFAYFNHSAHVRRGIGCVSCHGRVDTMEEVWQDQPLSMQWCVDCHRNPEKNLRDPAVDRPTEMDWKPPNGMEPLAYGRMVRDKYQIKPSTDCSTCHR